MLQATNNMIESLEGTGHLQPDEIMAPSICCATCRICLRTNDGTSLSIRS
ncbi:hypothetical protein EV128_13710 [Rhizobium azibense]|nr:hypothetical protein EV128_13710 [Rhizobium azibense]